MGEQGDRGRQRYVRFAWATLSGWGARFVSILSTIVIVPLTAGYLGAGRYGVWMTVSSVIGWLGMTDLGMGDRLTTALAQTTSTNQREIARRETSAVFWAVMAICSVLLLAVGAALPLVNWKAVFNAGGFASESELAWMTGVLAVLTILSVPLSLVTNVFDAHQEGWKVNAYSAVSSAVALIALVLAVRVKAGLAVLAAAMLAPQVMGLAVASGVVFGHSRPYLLSSWSSVDRRDMMTAAKGGWWYFLIAVQSLFWISKDNLLIARMLGPEQVAPYSTGFRVFFSLMGLLGGRIGQSLWPAYAEALASGHWQWIRSAYRRSTFATLAAYGTAAIVFATFAAPLIRLWAGKVLVTPAPVIWALAAEFTLLCWINLMGYLLMAADRPRPIAISGLIGGSLSVLLGIVLVRRIGLLGVPIANIICLLVFVLVPLHRVGGKILLGEAVLIPKDAAW